MSTELVLLFMMIFQVMSKQDLRGPYTSMTEMIAEQANNLPEQNLTVTGKPDEKNAWGPVLEQLLANQARQTQLLQSIQLRVAQSDREVGGKLAVIHQELRELDWGAVIGGVEGAVEVLRADLNTLRQAWEYSRTAETNRQQEQLQDIENKVNQINLMLRRISNQVQDIDHKINNNEKAVSHNISILMSLVNNKKPNNTEPCFTHGSSPSVLPPIINASVHHLPLDCWETFRQGHNTSGVFQIQPSPYHQPFMVLCDMDTLGGGWTVFQNREDGSTDFMRPWREFETGFGNTAAREFWLGLNKLHLITNARMNDLLITLQDHAGDSAWAYYEMFAIGNSDQEYAITSLGNYHGTAGDSIRGHVHKFSAQDRDNDINIAVSCGRSGAWWYQDCEDQEAPMSNLNGLYLNGSVPQVFPAQGMLWTTWRGLSYSIPHSAMMVRPSADVYKQHLRNIQTTPTTALNAP